ncbi:GNAT family N-acetyltransferase [Halobacillus sp. Marseille-P3879]|uniref:GNAT family N-acetyltransferase n=1 Tax=Halobacillus sp. Marseille-P3879 TaxID=2045014 RepID=UPI000C7ACEA1|nr:GNAT family N-acetyltransferase [Halobacillus sp. Marseille-P3879]
MIRKLNKRDDPDCQRLLGEKPAENLFIIGDIENFGYEQDFQTLWGDFDQKDRLRAVLLKYHNNFIAYASKSFDAEGFAAIINRDHEFMQISGLQTITDQILPYIEHLPKKKRALFYAKCESKEKLGLKLDTSQVKLASVKDVPEILNLHNQIVEFEQDDSRESSMIKGIEGKSTRIYYVKDDDQMVSSASTTAENSKSAMIVGVCTHPDFKRRGYASSCMKKLCEDLLDEGKMLCLFYDNPEAGSIYKRLGFEDIGIWTMNIFEPIKQPTS